MFILTPIKCISDDKYVSTVVCRRLLGALAVIGHIALLEVGSVSQAANYPPEQSLIGIKIFDRATTVLKKLGNPQRITTGSSAPDSTSSTNNQPTAAPTGVLPPLPMPGAPGAPAPELGGQSANGSASAAAQPSQATWEYMLKNNISVSLTLSSDGRVIQINVGGVRDHEVMTRRGITLGSLYSAVLTKYGYPESQDISGVYLRAFYTEKAHCGFLFIQNKVVGIIVAAVE